MDKILLYLYTYHILKLITSWSSLILILHLVSLQCFCNNWFNSWYVLQCMKVLGPTPWKILDTLGFKLKKIMAWFLWWKSSMRDFMPWKINIYVCIDSFYNCLEEINDENRKTKNCALKHPTKTNPAKINSNTHFCCCEISRLDMSCINNYWNRAGTLFDASFRYSISHIFHWWECYTSIRSDHKIITSRRCLQKRAHFVYRKSNLSSHYTKFLNNLWHFCNKSEAFLFCHCWLWILNIFQP